jgi:hypothetical protein
MARWLVDIIGKKLQHVGTVDADNEREALAEAIKPLRCEASAT